MSPGIGRRGGRGRWVLLLAAGLIALAGQAAAQNTLRSTASAPADQAAAAVDPQRLALAREYIRESHIDAAMRGMFANMARNLPQPTTDQASDVKSRQFLNSFSAGMDAALPMVMDVTAEATARTFTTQELKDLVAFYSSPSGQSMVAKMPTLMQQLVPRALQIMPKVYTVAETDFCQHETCTAADRAIFQRLEMSLRARLGRPAPRPPS